MFEFGPVQTQRQIRKYVSEERWMEAMVMSQQAVEHFPDWLEFRMLLAEVHRSRGNVKKAVAALEQLLALDREFPGARELLDALTLSADERLARSLLHWR